MYKHLLDKNRSQLSKVVDKLGEHTKQNLDELLLMEQLDSEKLVGFNWKQLDRVCKSLKLE